MEIRFECLPLQAKPSIFSMMMGTKLAKIMYTFAKNIYWQKTSFVWVACNGFVCCWSLQPLLFCFVFTCNMWSNAMITWSFVEGYYHLLQYKRFTLTYRNLWQSNWRVSLTHWHIKRQKCERAREREQKMRTDYHSNVECFDFIFISCGGGAISDGRKSSGSTTEKTAHQNT